MAKVTFTVEGERAGTIVIPVEIEGENGDRLLNWVMRTYPKLKEDKTPDTPDPVYSVTQYVMALVAGTLDNVRKAEETAAIQAALAAIAPIETKK
jgi:hypothetical protein